MVLLRCFGHVLSPPCSHNDGREFHSPATVIHLTFYFLSSTSTNSASTTLSFGLAPPPAAPAPGPLPSVSGAAPGVGPAGLYIASAHLVLDFVYCSVSALVSSNVPF